MKILNLGCGTKTCSKEGVVNIDWSMYLRLKRSKIAAAIAPVILDGERLKRFRMIPDNIVVHNLANGIPFESGTVDVVYHSHMLEHLDRDVAVKFLVEAKRVLKPGGIHRMVVPDLEQICRKYLTHLQECEVDPEKSGNHENYIAELIEQSVRREAFGTGTKKPSRRFLENCLLGDARRRGETHQWMYDRINMRHKLLHDVGYSAVHLQQYDTSLVPGWNDYGLDVDCDGNQYKPDSLYVEAVK